MDETPDSLEMLDKFMLSLEDFVLDADEFRQIFGIAMRDGVVDDAEKQVLREIIFSLTSSDFTPELWSEVERVIALLDLDEPG